MVIHDDMDLDFGRIKVKAGGSAGGHNGIKSIDRSLGTSKYARVRMGVGHAQRGAHAHDNTVNWVLGGFGPDQRKQLPEFLADGADAAETIIFDGLAKAQERSMAAEPTSPAQPPQLPTAGSLAGILDVLETDDDFRALIAGEIEEPESDIDPSITVGVPDGLRPALAAGAAGKQPVVLVVASSREAEEAVESIRSWYDGDPNDVAQLEAWETLPHERLSPRADTVASRMAVFRRLKHPEEGSTLFGPIRILVMPVRSLIQPVVAGLGGRRTTRVLPRRGTAS